MAWRFATGKMYLNKLIETPYAGGGSSRAALTAFGAGAGAGSAFTETEREVILNSVHECDPNLDAASSAIPSF